MCQNLPTRLGGGRAGCPGCQPLGAPQSHSLRRVPQAPLEHVTVQGAVTQPAGEARRGTKTTATVPLSARRLLRCLYQPQETAALRSPHPCSKSASPGELAELGDGLLRRVKASAAPSPPGGSVVTCRPAARGLGAAVLPVGCVLPGTTVPSSSALLIGRSHLFSRKRPAQSLARCSLVFPLTGKVPQSHRADEASVTHALWKLSPARGWPFPPKSFDNKAFKF